MNWCLENYLVDEENGNKKKESLEANLPCFFFQICIRMSFTFEVHSDCEGG